MSYAAIDQGSSSTKGALFSEDGSIRERVRIPIGVRREGDRVEHDPGEILRSVEDALARLVSHGAIDAVGLSCQRSTCLLWDTETGEPRTPALSWQDRRTAADLDSWSAADRREVARRTGLRLSPHYAGSKLAWLLDHDDGARLGAERGEITAGTLDAFLIHGLTGVRGTDPGHAGRTLLYDIEEDRWCPWLLERFGIPRDCLPSLMPSLAGRGHWEGLPVRLALGDQQSALVGHGDPEPGVVVVHFGTGAFVLAPTGGELVRDRALLSAVLWSDASRRRFQLEGSVNSAGSAVDWIVERTGFDLEGWAPERFDLETAPLCVPAFAGLGAPWWDPSARAAFFGLGESTGPEDLVAGVVAGVALRVVDNVRALGEAGLTPRTIRISGRLTRLEALGRLLADASGCRVEAAVDEEAGLAGTARLLGARIVPRTRRVWEPSWSPGERDSLRRSWERLVHRTSSRLPARASGSRSGIT